MTLPLRALTSGGLILLGLALTTPVAGQRPEEAEPPRILLTAWSGFSLREGQTTFRFADDVITFGGRLALNRGTGLRPWVQVDYFTRPELSCQQGLTCNDAGTLLRAGATFPLSEDDTRPGVHPRLIAGLGAGFSEETGLAYLLGFGAAWSLHPRVATIFEARWERIPGLRNFGLIGAGLRLGIL